MKYGQVILLNGTSSAGKTSIARSLQALLSEPYLIVPLDAFLEMFPSALLNAGNIEEIEKWAKYMPRLMDGYHRSVMALAKAGNNLIVDHVFEEDGWLQDCVRAATRLNVCYVGVKCPLEVLQEREKVRADRPIGQARYQFTRVHRYDIYDVEIDTSMNSPVEGAMRIVEYMEQRKRLRSESAFARLRNEFSKVSRQESE